MRAHCTLAKLHPWDARGARCTLGKPHLAGSVRDEGLTAHWVNLISQEG